MSAVTALTDAAVRTASAVSKTEGSGRAHMRWLAVAWCAVALMCVACSASTASATPSDKKICTAWVDAATAVNRGTAGRQSAAPFDPSAVAGLLADPAYAGNFQAVASLANTANDASLRDATTTLQAGIQASVNHTSVNQVALVNAMATLTRRCHDYGFIAQPVSSR